MSTPGSTSVSDLHDDASHDAETGAQLPIGFLVSGKYRIKRVLGTGGNGAVYEGEHNEVGHRVAIKVAHRKLDDRGDIMERFRREARICGSLRHPHVGQVFDVGTLDDGSPYMVMELQEGRSLGDVIDETKLPIAAIIDITRQLLSGLTAAHQANSVHLDVKPDNVMLVRDHGGDVVVKLVDFGISRRLNEPDPELREGDDQIIVGSPDYMPPEQLRGERCDVRTDLYATGVLLYETITGRPPFDGKDTDELVMSIMSDPIPSITSLRADCPAELERVVLMAMSRDPANRYQTAEEMSRALAGVRAGTRSSATSTGAYTPPSMLATLSERPPRPQTIKVRRRRTIDKRTLQTIRIRAPQQGPTVVFATQPREAHAPPHPSQKLAIGAMVAVACLIVIGAGWLSHRRSPGAGVSASAPVEAAAAAAAAEPTPPQAPSAHAVAAAPGTAAAVAPPPTAAAEQVAAVEAPRPAEPPPSAASRSERRSSSRSSARSSRASSPAPAARPAPAPVAAPAPPPPPPPPSQDPALTRTQLRAAAAAFKSGQTTKALQMFRQLVNVAPGSAEAWRGLAVTANKLGERADAERGMRRYLQLRPHTKDPGRILQSLAPVY